MAHRITALVLSAVGPAGAQYFHNEISTPIMGVTMFTVAACGFGGFAAIGFDDSKQPRIKQLFIGLSSVIMAAAAVGAIPTALGWTWSNGGAQGALGALTTFGFYYLLPPAITRAKELVRSFNPMDWLPSRKAVPQAPPPAPTAGKSGAIEDPDK